MRSESVPSPFRSAFRVAVLFAFFGVPTAFGAGGCGRSSSDDRPATTARPDLVLITVDTLRADRVGRGLTPALDALARRGVEFTQARAAVPLTLPSHVSIFTGAHPPMHGVRENGTYVFTGRPRSAARALKEAGYRTAAFVGAYVLDRRFGLADGFDHYDDQIARDPDAVLRLEAERPANEVVDRAVAWLADAGTGPAFLWVHLYDPHAPYKRSYDEDVTFADVHIGRLLDTVRAARGEPFVIVVGDHGESLGEHGERTHGMLLYEAAVRVPFIIAGPAIAPSRRDDPVSLVDVGPTLLGTIGQSLADVPGRDLLATEHGDREIYVETEYPRVAGWSPTYGLLQDRWKLIVSRNSELYDLATDPTESTNLASARGPLVRAMRARLDELRAAPDTTSRRAVAPDVADRLRALGYVAGTGEAPTPGDGPNPADHIEAWTDFEAALAEAASDDAPAALARLKRLVDAHPGAPVFHSTYARVLADSGAVAAALRVYRRAVQRWPTDAALFHELAVAARRAGRGDEALRAENAAIAIQPDLPAAHNGIGLLMTDDGQHRRAADAFERAVRADPTNAEYCVNLGNARRAAGDTSGAADAYRRAFDVDPRSADAANGIGVVLVQQQRPAEAVAWFERALQLSPDLIEAALNLGIAYQESGQRDRAREAYQGVLARAPRAAPERLAAADLLRSLER